MRNKFHPDGHSKPLTSSTEYLIKLTLIDDPTQTPQPSRHIGWNRRDQVASMATQLPLATTAQTTNTVTVHPLEYTE